MVLAIFKGFFEDMLIIFEGLVNGFDRQASEETVHDKEVAHDPPFLCDGVLCGL